MNERTFDSEQVKRGSKGILLAIAIVGVVCLFLFPIPRGLLDVLLALNLIISLILLLRGLLLHDPTQLFAFPTLLLLTTLFRLGLNISSTRLILLGGQQGPDAAGNIIKAFGESVVQGDFLVGAIIFGVIALVNFLVITRGAARVAEVSARFSLDSLPGKQLAIDADLRAGNITREEAEKRRLTLMRESGFYGAMDGAMRFIQGDAIAALAIVLINVIGGGILGTVYHDLSVQDSLRRFGVLSIGDGLVSMLPSLLISVCAGVVVTTVSRGPQITVSSQVLQTILSDRLALTLAGIAAIIFSSLPGFPFAPFVTIGFFVLLFAARPNLFADFQRTIQNRFSRYRGETWFRMLESPTFLPAVQTPVQRIQSESDGSIYLVDEFNAVTLELSKDAIERLGGISSIEQAYDQKRSELFSKRGIATLPIRLKVGGVDNVGRYKVIRYRVFLRGKFFKEGNCLADQNFIRNSPLKIISLGAEVRALGKDPITGVTGAWVDADPSLNSALKKLDIKWETPAEYLSLECIAAQLKNVKDLFGIDETKFLLAQLGQTAPRLAEEFNSGQLLTTFEICLIFKSLLHDRISIRDSKQIFEAVLEFISIEGPPAQGESRAEWLRLCVKSLRRKLSGSIIESFSNRGEPLRVFLLNQKLGDELKEVAEEWNDRNLSLPIQPARAVEIRRSMGKMLQPAYDRGQLPIVVLCESEIREAVDELLSARGIISQKSSDEIMTREWYRTLSFDEVESAVRVETIGILPG